MTPELHHALGVLNQVLDFKYELLIEYLAQFDRPKSVKRAEIITERLKLCYDRYRVLPNDRITLKIAVAFISKYELMWLRFVNDFVSEERAGVEAENLTKILTKAYQGN